MFGTVPPSNALVDTILFFLKFICQLPADFLRELPTNFHAQLYLYRITRGFFKYMIF